MICFITFNTGGEADSELLETLGWITQLKLTMLGFELTLVSWPSSYFLHHVSFLAAKRTSNLVMMSRMTFLWWEVHQVNFSCLAVHKTMVVSEQ